MLIAKGISGAGWLQRSAGQTAQDKTNSGGLHPSRTGSILPAHQQNRSTIMPKRLAALALAAILTLSCDPLLALPRFASRTGAKCQSCHVNPSGGAMRQAFGVRYGREELPVPTWSEEFQMEDFTNVIANVLGIGADMRTLYYSRGSSNAFWQMQGDLYVHFRLAKKVSLFLNKGLYSGFEVFGMLQILPANGYVKVGKFLPNYGTKLDDHTVFVRTYTGFSPELGRPELTGAEAAISPGPITITGGIYNAADGFGSAVGNTKAYLGRIEGMFALTDGINLGIGGNIFGKGSLSSTVMSRIASDIGVNLAVTGAGVSNTLMGGFGSFSLHDLTLFGEVDFMKSKVGSTTTNGIIVYAEADYPLVTGVDLKLAYDFYDPDKDVKSGSISRYSAGVEFFPIAGVEVRPVYRFLKTQNRVAGDGDDSWREFHLLFHFYF
jgi:hypothetical protein